MDELCEIKATSLDLGEPLEVQILKDGLTARLLKPYCIKTAKGHIIKVPAGFETDFASVPRLFWSIIPPWGRYSPAAVIHDYLYSTNIVSRLQADRIFLYCMKVLEVPFFKRHVMFWAVRLFGWLPMKKNRNVAS